MPSIISPIEIIAVTNKFVQPFNIASEPNDDVDNGIQFTSQFGTPVYSPLEFLKDNSGTSLDNSLGVGAQTTSETLLRIDSVLFVVNGTFNIVKTPIVGKQGTVKEYISQGDYTINCKGAIVGEFLNQYPVDQVRLLIQLLTLAKPLKVACEFLLQFGIDHIVIDPEFTISQKMGSRNEVPFEFNAVSDFPDDFELSISQ